MNRQPRQQQFAAPGARPWMNRAGGPHPLTGVAAAAPTAAAAPAPAASWRGPQPAGRPAAAAHQGAIPLLPNLGLGGDAAQAQAPLPGLHQAMSRLAAAAAPGEPTAHAQRPLPFIQPLLGSQQAGFAPFSQRSQLDNIQLSQPPLTQPELEYGGEYGQDAAVGSAPQPQPNAVNAAADTYDDGGVLPSQPEVTRQQRLAPAEAAAKLLERMHRPPALGAGGERSSEELDAQLGAIGGKLEALAGGQAGVAAVVGHLQDDLAAQGQALGGLGKTCAELMQAVQSIAGATSGIEGRLQALLAKPPVVTGDMGIQTSPALAGVVAASIQTSPVLARMAAAGTQVSPTLLHAFNQRRPSTADRQLAAAPPSAAATAPARGLRSAAATAGAVVPQPTAKPTTSALAAAPSLARRQANRPAAAVVAVAPQPEALPRTTAKRSGAPKARLPAQVAAAAAAAVTPPKRQRASGGRKRPAEAEAPRPALRPTQPCAAPAAAAAAAAPVKPPSRAEMLFDSLFDSEAAEAEAAPPAKALAAASQPAAAPADSGAAMAAAVQRRLEKHRARFTRRRRNASQRQEESEEQ